MKISVLLSLLFTFSLLAQTGKIERKIYTAIQTNPHPPTIDGKPNDAVWKRAIMGDGFIQSEPVERDTSSEKTYFKICYDEKNLYVLIHARDSQPEKITARLARRDEIDDSDVVGVMLDSYLDHRTAFEFSVNAAGVKRDAVFSNDEFNQDKSWEPVWEAKTAINDSGWVAEMRIPFSQLRFSASSDQTWGLEVYRYIYRKQELDVWQFIPKDAPGFVSNFGYLKGVNNIHMPRRVELLPYAVSELHAYEKEPENPFAPGRNFTGAGGLDGKIGLTGNLTVDFTINPDFGQVEADPSEVNLTAFETFFEEKRPFFIEGKNIFQFPLGMGDGDFARETLFYSRRIGRTPHHYPDVDEDNDEYVDFPEQTSILGAAKLSGKTASGWSIGVLDALTAEEKAKIDANGNRRKETVEPLTNYFVGRLQKDFHQGNTSFGGMVTATNRNINHSYLDFLNRSGYSGGIDINHQWRDKTYFFNLKTAFSHIRGHPDAILEAQTSSARYFQRPDANYLTLDSSRTQMSGHGGSFGIGKQGGGHWRFAFGGIWRSPGLELNDIGFLQQADRVMEFIWVGYRIFNPVGIFRRVNINANLWNGWNFGGEKLFAGGNINGGAQFLNYWGFHTGINRSQGGISPSALRGGPALRNEGGWNNWFGIYSDSRKTWQIELGGFHHWDDDRVSNSRNLRLSLYLKPGNSLNISLNPFYSVRTNNLQYVDIYDFNGSDRYVLAKLDQKTLGIVLRINVSLTPELTIQYYGQPFISAGSYSRFKRITHPRAKRYEDRFHTFTENEISYHADEEQYEVDENRDGGIDYRIDLPDFNFKQFRSNLVIRWEYHPGSQLYLVWSQGRTGSDSFSDFSLHRDFEDLFSIVPDNVFLLKVNHWFSL